MTGKCAWAGFPFLSALILSAAFRSSCNYILALAAVGFGMIGFAALKKRRAYVAVCLISFLAGIALNTAYTELNYKSLTAFDGKTVTIKGFIKDFSYIGSDTSRITVEGKVRGIKTQISFYVPYDDFHYYDGVTVEGKVSRIHDSVEFQSGEYYYSKGVFLQGGSGTARLTGKNHNMPLRIIKEYRDRLMISIKNVCPDSEGAFLAAMLCGDKSEMPQSLKTSVYRSGIGHIFAVSGAHLVIAAALFSAVASRAVRNRRLLFMLEMAEIWGFAAFAGFSVTVVRAAVMLSLSKAGVMFGRKSDCLNSLGLCAVALTVSSPYSAVSPSFLMSFSAVFALGVIAPNIISRTGEDRGVVCSSAVSAASVLLFTAPLCVIFFGGLSVITVISNLLLIPLCTLALQLCLIAVFAGGADIIAVPIFKLAGLAVKPVLAGAEFISAMPFSYIPAGRGMLPIIAASAVVPIAAVFLCRRKNIFSVSCTAVVCFWIAVSNTVRIVNGGEKIAVMPGGDSCLYVVSKGGEAIVLDVGCKGGLNGAAERYIRVRSIDSITLMLVSEGGIYTIGRVKSDLSVQPGAFLTSKDAESIYDDAVYLGVNGDVNFKDLRITFLGDSYRLENGCGEFVLGEKEMYVNGSRYDLEDEEYPLEVNTENFRVRRTGYGFD